LAYIVPELSLSTSHLSGLTIRKLYSYIFIGAPHTGRANKKYPPTISCR